MRTLLYCLLLSLLPCGIEAQNYKDDILQSLKVYTLPRLQLESKVDVYSSYSATQPFQSHKAIMKKDGGNYYSEMGDMRMLLNEKFLVMVYKSDKQIVCTQRNKHKEKKTDFQGDPTSAIDSILRTNDSVVYKGIHDGLKTYIIYTGHALIRRTEIYLDTKNGYISQLVYYYNEQLMPLSNKVRIQYTINTAPVFAENEFSEKRFISINHGAASAAGECAGYEVTYIDSETYEPIEK